MDALFRRKTAALQLLFVKFPTKINRENFANNRDQKQNNREFKWNIRLKLVFGFLPPAESALPPKADIELLVCHVRFVPTRDSCAAAKLTRRSR